MSKRVYISGPMTGYPDFNKPAFNREAERLRVLGYDVVNPAELNPDETTPWHECLRNDIAHLVTCDALVMIEGWERSNGAHLEIHIAHRVGMEIMLARDLIA
jgi:hypothetical protein